MERQQEDVPEAGEGGGGNDDEFADEVFDSPAPVSAAAVTAVAPSGSSSSDASSDSSDGESASSAGEDAPGGPAAGDVGDQDADMVFLRRRSMLPKDPKVLAQLQKYRHEEKGEFEGFDDEAKGTSPSPLPAAVDGAATAGEDCTAGCWLRKRRSSAFKRAQQKWFVLDKSAGCVAYYSEKRDMGDPNGRTAIYFGDIRGVFTNGAPCCPRGCPPAAR